MARKIEQAVIDAIRAKLATGESIRKVSADLGVDRATVSRYAAAPTKGVPGLSVTDSGAVEGHLDAILAMRMNWTDADRLLASQLANLRTTLDKERERLAGEPATVATAAGSTKANPAYQVIDRLSRQEAQLSRRLGLGMQRTAGGRYEAAKSPAEARVRLWESLAEDCHLNLLPGLWYAAVDVAGCAIPEDSQGWPNNPLSLPVTGQVHTVGDYYPVRQAPMLQGKR